MEFFTSLLLVLSLAFSSLMPFTPVTLHAYNSNHSHQTELIDLNLKQGPTIKEKEPEIDPIRDNTYNTSSFVTLDFEGYCTIEVPESHMTLRSSSTNTQKDLLYKDNKTRLTMSFVTNIGSDADIPGYITREVAGVDTTTNDKKLETYGDNRTWMMVPSQNRVDGNDVIVWYTLNESSTAAFWVRANIAPDSKDNEFFSVMRQIFDTYNTYGGNGTLFGTPDSGYYEGMTPDESTKGDTSDFKANNALANQVFASRGGYIPDADISADWKDLEIIIDKVKFKLPCTLDDFYNETYVVNDKFVTADHMKVKAGSTLDVSLENDNGTVIVVTFYNDNLKMEQDASDCKIMRIIVDPDNFVSVSDEEKIRRQKDRDKIKQDQLAEAEAEAAKKAEEEAAAEEEAKKAEEEANAKYVIITKNVNVRTEPNTTCTVIKEALPDEYFKYIGDSDDGKWFKIQYDKDTEAYIRTTYAKIASDEEKNKILESSSNSNSDEDSTDDSEQSENKEEDKGPTKLIVQINRSTTLMSEPDSNSSQMTTLVRTEIFDYIDISEDKAWYQIQYKDRKGWVRATQSEVVELTEEEYKEEMTAYKLQSGELIELKDGTIITEEEYIEYGGDLSSVGGEERDPNRIEMDKSKWDESYDSYGHQMILAGGVTWPAYADDIIAYYGNGVTKSNHNNGQQLRLKWSSGEKYMTLITGNIKQIYYVELSCVPSN